LDDTESQDDSAVKKEELEEDLDGAQDDSPDNQMDEPERSQGKDAKAGLEIEVDIRIREAVILKLDGERDSTSMILTPPKTEES